MKLTIFASVFAAVLLVASPANAAKPVTPTNGVHFTQAGQPSCIVTDGSVDCTAELVGVGQSNISTLATIQALATYSCQNKGGNIAAGQNKVPGPAVGSGEPTVTPAAEITNGRVTVSDSAGPATVAPTVSGKTAGCPNGNWVGVNPVTVGYYVHFECSQGGVLLFSREGETTSNGPVALTVNLGGVA